MKNLETVSKRPITEIFLMLFIQFYDFNTPYKILLTWHNPEYVYKDKKIDEVLGLTDDVVNFCKKSGIKNAGNIINNCR